MAAAYAALVEGSAHHIMDVETAQGDAETLPFNLGDRESSRVQPADAARCLIAIDVCDGRDSSTSESLNANTRRRIIPYALGVIATAGCFAVVARSFAPSTSSSGCNCNPAEQHKMLHRLGFIEYDEVDSPEVPTSQCKDNTYFVDWGSSGAKVHLVHVKDSRGDRPLLPMKQFKIKGLRPDSTDVDKTEFLDSLQSSLAPGTDANAVILATAGFRLHPEASDATWHLVRKWNDEERFFQSCSEGKVAKQKGCQTLAGSEEARYELKSMLAKQCEAEKGFFNGTKHVGLASCGGASIQLGISNASVEDMRKCHNDLSPIPSQYDSHRLETIEKKHLFLFSWLAANNAHLEKGGKPSDYMVGGVDEMRSRFDAWLESRGLEYNPCIPKEANKFFKATSQCHSHSHHHHHKTCLSDRFGSYITSLPGDSASTQKSCRESVQKFVDDDLMISRWRSSRACLDLASSTKKWGFVSSFGRAAQLGHDVTKPSTWGDVQKCLLPKDDELIHEDEETMKKGFFGKPLTSTLLITVLNSLGLDPDSKVMSSEAQAADLKMADYGLRPGWVDKC